MKIFSTYLVAICVAALCSMGSVWATPHADADGQIADSDNTSHRPRLVINIVVSSMRANDLDRYAANFCNGGFERLRNGGAHFTNAHLGYLNTSTPAGLATITTGAQPSEHGVVGTHWWNFVDGTRVELINDNKSYSVDFSTGSGNYSPHRLVAPTLGDMLIADDSRNKQITIAIDPVSAITMNGKSGVAYWAETNQTHWTTSSAYTDKLPKWVKEYNQSDTNSYYTLSRWTTLYNATSYRNDEVAVVEGISGKSTRLLSDINLNLAKDIYGKMRYTPAGNTMLLKFAASAIAQEKLGQDDAPDILNICLDTPRYVAETYGPESMEYEDMLYRLDKDLEEFLLYAYAQVGDASDIVVVLCSDHGTSPSYNPVGGDEHERFNTRQMEVIVNAFLGAKHGSNNYILGFANNAIYLNHTLIRDKGLSIDAIRDEVAVFVLQLRGVATARSTTALRNTSFEEGRGRMMQRSFYATRSGDIVLDPLPGWIIENGDYRSTSLSGYNYDSHIPLIIYGGGIEAQTIERETDITQLAATISHLIGIGTPWAASGHRIVEIE